MELKARPVLDRIIIRQDQAADKIGSLLIPEAAKVAPRQGTVLAVGPGVRLADGKVIPLEVKVGDKVIYMEHSGHPIVIDGEKYIIVEENKLLIIL